MNLREWVKATHQALSSQPAEKRQRDFLIAEVDVILREGIDVLKTSLDAGNDLRLNDLGRLWVEDKRPVTITSNLAGKARRFIVRKKRIIRFRASYKFLKYLNGDVEHSDMTQG